jgi:hypothetical protein
MAHVMKPKCGPGPASARTVYLRAEVITESLTLVQVPPPLNASTSSRTSSSFFVLRSRFSSSYKPEGGESRSASSQAVEIHQENGPRAVHVRVHVVGLGLGGGEGVDALVEPVKDMCSTMA